MSWKTIFTMVLSLSALILAIDANGTLTSQDKFTTSQGLGAPVTTPLNATYTKVTATAYSAACRYDSSGGKDESALLGKAMRPTTMAINIKNPALSSKVVMAAVPQIKGTSALFGCFFHVHIPPTVRISAELRQAIEGVEYFAADHYGKGSNKKMKVDISYSCSPQLKMLTMKDIVVSRDQCPRKVDARTAVAEMSRKLEADEVSRQAQAQQDAVAEKAEREELQRPAPTAQPARSAYNGVDFYGTPISR